MIPGGILSKKCYNMGPILISLRTMGVWNVAWHEQTCYGGDFYWEKDEMIRLYMSHIEAQSKSKCLLSAWRHGLVHFTTKCITSWRTAVLSTYLVASNICWSSSSFMSTLLIYTMFVYHVIPNMVVHGAKIQWIQWLIQHTAVADPSARVLFN